MREPIIIIMVFRARREFGPEPIDLAYVITRIEVWMNLSLLALKTDRSIPIEVGPLPVNLANFDKVWKS